MNLAIATNRLKPILDPIFSFEEVHPVFRYYEDARLLGKVVILH